MIKPLSIALALGLAASGVTAFADDTSGSTNGTQMQQCVAKQKAKNDGRSDADISRACTAQMQKHDSSNTMTPAPGTSPGTVTPNHPSTSTPNDPAQVPK